MTGLRIWRIACSTNVERVALALAHKGLTADWIDVPADDRAAVRQVSGQDLVPVLQTPTGHVITDSMAIVAWLDNDIPERPLWPSDPAGRATTDRLVEWFNRVWKGPPNAIADELAGSAPDAARIARWSAEMAGWLPRFEALLSGRAFLLGDLVGAADICAFPFLKYAVLPVAADDEDPFHRVLADHLVLGAGFSRLTAWIERMNALPRS